MNDIMGVPVGALDMAATVSAVIAAIGRGEGGWLVNPNLDVLRQISSSAELRELVSAATLVVADGMPLVWAAAIAGRPLPSRVPGSTLIYALAEAAAASGASVFLLGGAPGTSERAATALAGQFPGLTVAGSHCPPPGFESNPEQLAAITDVIERSQPDLVFVGLGFPKQERLVARLRPIVPRSYFVGVGVSFSFVTGDIVRAPLCLQRLGLEWLHRLVQEPRRLFRRYIVHDAPFTISLFSWAARVRLLRMRGE